MIDPREPDYSNTPISGCRPDYGYQPGPAEGVAPLSIVTPCYNVEPWYFEQTVQNVLSQSLQNFEWILVDDGSTEPASLAALEGLSRRDSRVQLIRQKNSGPGAARNRGASEARGKFLFWLDADDLIEPTYLEKAMWCLESHPQFAFCNSWTVGFGTQEYIWPRGFDCGRVCLEENQSDNKTVVRKEIHEQSEGFDESIRVGHEDWEYWLNMASHGFWGWTLPEFLIWYRRRDDSRLNETEKDNERKLAFTKFLRTKHAPLYEDVDRFPRPPDPDDLAPSQVTFEMPWANPLANPGRRNRMLLVVPWLEMGGADQFNLDLVMQLKKRGWDITIATTMPSHHLWMPQFTRLTPDVFCLDRFLKLADYPRFLLYLLRSRSITHGLISNSQLGYELLPMLRSHHSEATFLDCCHSTTPEWKNGGYPSMSACWQDSLDLHTVSNGHLEDWLVKEGVPRDRVEAFHTNIDVEKWDPDRVEPQEWRGQLIGADGSPDRVIILFAGRFVEDKRPDFLVEVLRSLHDAGTDFVAALTGEGPLRPQAESLINKYGLQGRVRLLGTLAPRQMPGLYAAADIFLLPSQVEGISVGLFEAMAMGTVPVSASVGGQAELVTPDVGYLIPHQPRQEEIRAYCDVLTRLIADPTHRKQLAGAARRRILQGFTLDDMGDRLHGTLLEAEANHRHRPQPTIPRSTAGQCAVLGVERFRLERLADQLWIQSQQGAVDAPGATIPQADTSVSLARAELSYIEHSRSWRTIQRFKQTWVYRAFARLIHGPDWDRFEYADPRDQLTAIKRSRFYRLLQSIKRTSLYRTYARRKYGPAFANPWG